MRKEERFIVKQYLKSARRGFLSFLLFFSFLGIFIGVAALIIVIAVMTGFQNELKNRIIGLSPHITVTRFFDIPIEHPDSIVPLIKEIDGVVDAEPYILTKTIVVKGDYTDGVVLKGVKKLPQIIDTAFVMGDGKLREKSCVVGVNLAALMRAKPGDTLRFYVPNSAKKTPFGMVLKSIDLTVEGVFDAGMYDYNTSFVLAPLKDAEKIQGHTGVSGIEVKLKDPEKAPHIAKKIEKTLGYPYTTTTWIEMNRSLFYALRLEKITLFIVLSLIVVVASFGIITTLMMLVMEKTQEIGILMAMGYKRAQIKRIFVFIGLIIGTLGVTTGAAFGILFSYLLEKYQFVHMPADVYFINHVAVQVNPRDVAITVILALFISYLATIIPATRASKLEPVDALRYE